MKMKKKLVVLLSALLLLSGCGTSNNAGEKKQEASADSSEVIKLGGIIPKSGPVANYGNSTENGIKMAVEEINENGGINGKKIEYISEDDKGDSTEAMNVYSKFVESGVNGIVGPITSKPALAVAENSVNDGIPVVTPTGTMESITEGNGNVFRICFTDPMQGLLLANFASGKLGAKTVAVLRNNSSDYSNGVSDKFISSCKEKGLEVLADEGYGSSDKDFKAQLTNIKSKNPDVLLISDYYENNIVVVRQARDLGLKSTIIGPDGWDGVLGVVAKGEESSLDGIYFTNHYSVKDTKEVVKNFVDNYKSKYGEDPSAFSALGYDAIYAYKNAFENTKSMDYKDVVEALKKVEIEGVTGSLKFGENNNPIKSCAIMKIQDGQYILDSYVGAE